MHPALIKAALELTTPPSTQIGVARQCGVTPPVVFDVIQGNRRSRNVEQHIAAATGLALGELWPQHYPAETKPSKALRAMRAALR